MRRLLSPELHFKDSGKAGGAAICHCRKAPGWTAMRHQRVVELGHIWHQRHRDVAKLGATTHSGLIHTLFFSFVTVFPGEANTTCPARGNGTRAQTTVT